MIVFPRIFLLIVLLQQFEKTVFALRQSWSLSTDWGKPTKTHFTNPNGQWSYGINPISTTFVVDGTGLGKWYDSLTGGTLAKLSDYYSYSGSGTYCGIEVSAISFNVDLGSAQVSWVAPYSGTFRFVITVGGLYQVFPQGCQGNRNANLARVLVTKASRSPFEVEVSQKTSSQESMFIFYDVNIPLDSNDFVTVFIPHQHGYGNTNVKWNVDCLSCNLKPLVPTVIYSLSSDWTTSSNPRGPWHYGTANAYLFNNGGPMRWYDATTKGLIFRASDNYNRYFCGTENGQVTLQNDRGSPGVTWTATFPGMFQIAIITGGSLLPDSNNCYGNMNAHLATATLSNSIGSKQLVGLCSETSTYKYQTFQETIFFNIGDSLTLSIPEKYGSGSTQVVWNMICVSCFPTTAPTFSPTFSGYLQSECIQCDSSCFARKGECVLVSNIATSLHLLAPDVEIIINSKDPLTLAIWGFSFSSTRLNFKRLEKIHSLTDLTVRNQISSNGIIIDITIPEYSQNIRIEGIPFNSSSTISYSNFLFSSSAVPPQLPWWKAYGNYIIGVVIPTVASALIFLIYRHFVFTIIRSFGFNFSFAKKSRDLSPNEILLELRGTELFAVIPFLFSNGVEKVHIREENSVNRGLARDMIVAISKEFSFSEQRELSDYTKCCLMRFLTFHSTIPRINCCFFSFFLQLGIFRGFLFGISWKLYSQQYFDTQFNTKTTRVYFTK